jgi:hypothetical protein
LLLLIRIKLYFIFFIDHWCHNCLWFICHLTWSLIGIKSCYILFYYFLLIKLNETSSKLCHVKTNVHVWCKWLYQREDLYTCIVFSLLMCPYQYHHKSQQALSLFPSSRRPTQNRIWRHWISVKDKIIILIKEFKNDTWTRIFITEIIINKMMSGLWNLQTCVKFYIS